MQFVPVAVAALLWLVLAGCAEAKRVALVVGNGAYLHASPLVNPSNDARDVADVLRKLNFNVITGINLGSREFDEAVLEFLKQSNGAEIAILYYSGHGVQFDGSNYLIPVDVSINHQLELRKKTVHAQAVLHHMERNAKVSLVFLDACRDNNLTRSLQKGSRSQGGRRGLALMEADGNAMIAFAAAPNRVASDGDPGQRNSPFTAAILRHLGTPNVAVTEMLTEVTREVVESTRGMQKPEVLSRLTTQVRLNEDPLVSGAIARRKKAEEEASAAEKRAAIALQKVKDAETAAILVRPPTPANSVTQPRPVEGPLASSGSCPRGYGQAYQVTGVSSDDVLWMRGSPNHRATQIYAIPPNGRGITKGECQSVSGQIWCNITYDCRTGWSNAHFLIEEGSAVRVTDQQTSRSAAVIGVASDDVLWLRPAPGDLRSSLGSLSHNAGGIDVLECRTSGPTTWCRVRSGNLTGWVNARYLRR